MARRRWRRWVAREQAARVTAKKGEARSRSTRKVIRAPDCDMCTPDTNDIMWPPYSAWKTMIKTSIWFKINKKSLKKNGRRTATQLYPQKLTQVVKTVHENSTLHMYYRDQYLLHMVTTSMDGLNKERWGRRWWVYGLNKCGNWWLFMKDNNITYVLYNQPCQPLSFLHVSNLNKGNINLDSVVTLTFFTYLTCHKL